MATRRDAADTLMVPARQEGFEEVFLGKSQWYFVPLAKDRVAQLKHLLIYVSKPVSSTTHLADIVSFEEFEPTTPGGKPRYKFFLNNTRPAKRLQFTGKMGLQGPALVRLSDLESASCVEDLFKRE